MKILVTGGTGYIGSLTVKHLQQAGYDVTVFDNLVYGHKDSINCRLVQGDLLDKDSLFSSLKNEDFEAVIHFAAYAYAGESMTNPYKYFDNNLIGGLNLLEYMKESYIKQIIFSSSCSIYGTPKKLPVTEESEKHPESVYGESKYMFEQILSWYEKIYNIKYINLRYFNAAGASIDGTLGEDHNPETHIIPLAIKATIENKPFTLFGDDYPTQDGSCIRDYIHIEDLASGHIQALEYLQKSGKSDSFNLGTGNGYSNKELLAMIQKVSGKEAKVIIAPRRFGDPPAIYANCAKAKKMLGFEPKYSDLRTIIETAWKWHSKNP